MFLLISKDFLKLVLVAFVVAAPIAYVGISGWLESFAYRADLPTYAWTYLAAGGAVLVLGLAVGSYHGLRAALMNPATALKTE